MEFRAAPIWYLKRRLRGMCLLQYLCNDIKLIIYRYLFHHNYRDVIIEYNRVWLSAYESVRFGRYYWDDYFKCNYYTGGHIAVANYRYDITLFCWRILTLTKRSGAIVGY